MDDADQHRDKRQRLGTEEREAGEHTIAGISKRLTNHERQPVGSSSGDVKSSAEVKEDSGLGLFLVKTRKALLPPCPLTLPALVVSFG